MDTTIRRLPDAELEVMQAIWACEPPVSRADINKILKDTHQAPQAQGRCVRQFRPVRIRL